MGLSQWQFGDKHEHAYEWGRVDVVGVCVVVPVAGR